MSNLPTATITPDPDRRDPRVIAEEWRREQANKARIAEMEQAARERQGGTQYQATAPGRAPGAGVSVRSYRGTVSGPISTFGGPFDAAEAKTGLAFTTLVNWRAAGAILAWLAKPWPRFFRGLFLHPLDAAELAKKQPGFGPFAFLNPKALYYAERDSKDGRYDDKNPWRTFLFNGKAVTAQRIDWGPNVKTGCVHDVSPAVMKGLGAKYKSVVVSRPATAAEIEKAKAHNAGLLENPRGLFKDIKGAFVSPEAQTAGLSFGDRSAWLLAVVAAGGVYLMTRKKK